MKMTAVNDFPSMVIAVSVNEETDDADPLPPANRPEAIAEESKSWHATMSR